MSARKSRTRAKVPTWEPFGGGALGGTLGLGELGIGSEGCWLMREFLPLSLRRVPMRPRSTARFPAGVIALWAHLASPKNVNFARGFGKEFWVEGDGMLHSLTFCYVFQFLVSVRQFICIGAEVARSESIHMERGSCRILPNGIVNICFVFITSFGIKL